MADTLLTGCNRAILGALDTASILCDFAKFERKQASDEENELKKVLEGRETVFGIMQHSAPNTLKSDFKHQTTSPSSRYLHLPPPAEHPSLKLMESM